MELHGRESATLKCKVFLPKPYGPFSPPLYTPYISGIVSRLRSPEIAARVLASFFTLGGRQCVASQDTRLNFVRLLSCDTKRASRRRL